MLSFIFLPPAIKIKYPSKKALNKFPIIYYCIILHLITRYLLTCLFLLVLNFSFSQEGISLCSWNLKDFGKSKSTTEIIFIAGVVKDFDVIAIQEVVAGDGGAQAVARLADELNRKGSHWDYTVSDPTYSSSYKQERYAFIWKTSRLKKMGDAWLEKKYNLEIDREPYYATFESASKRFTLVNFHAITKKLQPETEIKYFKFLPEQYPDLNLIFAGDFNCPQSHTVFNPLKKMGWLPALTGQKTSLRHQCIGDDCLASEFDNIFYPAAKVSFISSGILPFYKDFESMEEANHLSDHVPVYLQFTLN